MNKRSYAKAKTHICKTRQGAKNLRKLKKRRNRQRRNEAKTILRDPDNRVDTVDRTTAAWDIS